MPTRLLSALALAALAVMTVAAKKPEPPVPYAARPYVTLVNPEWSKNATLYELNTRQFTPEGTFRAAEAQLPRLKALGIDIIWLMPIHPIGEKNRKGTLGSPYSVRNYYTVNPEFGTMADLKAFVATAHKLGMHVILDWVANHTAWDNPLVTEHPDYYLRDWKGDFRPTPWWDWSDIIDLDYSKPGVRRHVAEAMLHWVREADVDGFRADVAGYVPLDFWEDVRARLGSIKPVFMLGEGDSRDLHARAFDASYAWGWYDAMHAIAKGKADTTALYGYYSNNESLYPREAMRMMFVENHDKNAWDGTMYEAFGDALTPAIVLSVIGEGIPLVHNGQEAGNRKRLAFFEKDPIVWRADPVGDLYRKLFAFKKANPALWNGKWGARMEKVANTAEGEVFSFIRRGEKNSVFAAFNLSAAPVEVRFPETLVHGAWRNFDDGKPAQIGADSVIAMPAWSYRVYSR